MAMAALIRLDDAFMEDLFRLSKSARADAAQGSPPNGWQAGCIIRC